VKQIEEEACQVKGKKARPRKDISANICIVIGMKAVIIDIEQEQAKKEGQESRSFSASKQMVK
jgi:hypothetical protein